MKKVCIVTNYSATTNYGAIFQAYALNKKLASMGYDVRTLHYKRSGSSNKHAYMQLLKKFEFKKISVKIRSKLSRARVEKKLQMRTSAFQAFRMSIPHTALYGPSELPKLQDEFDVFIAGSDQIFRPQRDTNLLNNVCWLSMIQNNAVKASYAASLGIDRLPPELEPLAKEYLSSFDYISIREESAARYFSELTGRLDIISSIDPVFLLGADEWRALEKPYEIPGKYLLVYMIHGTEQLLRSIKAFAEGKDLKIVIFPSMAYTFRSYEKGIGDIEVYDAVPEQFLYLVDHASYIFTDSFHGTAFSTILHKKMFVSHANRVAYSRIANLMEKLGVSNSDVPAEGLPPEKYDVAQRENWDLVDERIAQEQKRSEEYLRSVIEGSRE